MAKKKPQGQTVTICDDVVGAIAAQQIWVLARFIGARLHIEGVTDNHGHALRWRHETTGSRIAGPFEVLQ
jgi:hypothetical protein